VIWTDVKGLLTADPKLVAEARTISEISYQEATELAHFGAKVLHPKTLRPVMQSGIPVWIKNTFAPEQPGTKITSAVSRKVAGATALAVVRDATLIRVRLRAVGLATQSRIQDAPNAFARVVATSAAVRADVLLISESAENDEICFAVMSPLASLAIEGLRHEFPPELQHEELERVVFCSEASVITVVSRNMPIASEVVVVAFAALREENINILATSKSASTCSMSLAVPRQQMEMALAALHHELGLGGAEPNHHPGNSGADTTLNPAAIWKCQPQPASAD
jgi:aspartate kinase